LKEEDVFFLYGDNRNKIEGNANTSEKIHLIEKEIQLISSSAETLSHNQNDGDQHA
jgi:hypothetical protein